MKWHECHHPQSMGSKLEDCWSDIGGVVGPGSLAKITQREVHRLIGNDLPQGWDYQLKNEPILNLAYEYRHRLRIAGRREAWSIEALPIGEGWLGNMLTQAGVGALLRAGYNVADDFGPTLLRGLNYMPPPRHREDANSDWGFSVYGGGVGNLVLRDITLDGNTFQDSRSVDKKLFVPMGGVGMAVGNRFRPKTAMILSRPAAQDALWALSRDNRAEASRFLHGSQTEPDGISDRVARSSSGNRA